MPTMIEQVREFHNTFYVPEADSPQFPAQDRQVLRMKLITEEYAELMSAMGFAVNITVTGPTLMVGANEDMHVVHKYAQKNLVEVADGISDLHYVLSGTSLEYGLPEDEVFAEVHRSNMSKADEDGTVHKRYDGKILKSKRWSPPNILDILFKKA